MDRQEQAMRDLYIRLLKGWNDRDAAAMAAASRSFQPLSSRI